MDFITHSDSESFENSKMTNFPSKINEFRHSTLEPVSVDTLNRAHIHSDQVPSRKRSISKVSSPEHRLEKTRTASHALTVHMNAEGITHLAPQTFINDDNANSSQVSTPRLEYVSSRDSSRSPALSRPDCVPASPADIPSKSVSVCAGAVPVSNKAIDIFSKAFNSANLACNNTAASHSYLTTLIPRSNSDRIDHLQSQIHLLNKYLLSVTSSEKANRLSRLAEIHNLNTLVPAAQKFLDDARHARRFSKCNRAHAGDLESGIECRDEHSEEDGEDLRIAKLLSQRSRLVVYLSNKMVLPLNDIPPTALFLLSNLPTMNDKLYTLIIQSIRTDYNSLVNPSPSGSKIKPTTSLEISSTLAKYLPEIHTLATLSSSPLVFPFLSFPSTSSTVQDLDSDGLYSATPRGIIFAAIKLVFMIAEYESREDERMEYIGVTGETDKFLAELVREIGRRYMQAIMRVEEYNETGEDEQGEENRNGYVTGWMKVMNWISKWVAMFRARVVGDDVNFLGETWGVLREVRVWRGEVMVVPLR